MELIGKVLWWSDEDQNGIIVDPNGNEFYFDYSVLTLKPKQNIKRKSILLFEFNENISDCLCAKNVKIPVSTKKKSVEQRFNRESIIQL